MRAVLFDAGNTLLELDYAELAASAAEFVPAATAEAARHAEWRARRIWDTPEAARAHTDYTRWFVYLRAIAEAIGVPEAARDAFFERVHRLHERKNLWRIAPPGTDEFLQGLRAAGWMLGVVSNSQGNVEELLAKAGLRRHLDVVVDSALFGVEKPDPRIFLDALRQLRVEPRDAWYVGDMYWIDVVGATAAGLHAVLLDPAGLHGDKPCARAANWTELGALLPRE